MRLFFDLEFTGLHQMTTLVSLGIIAEDGRSFYAEATDFDRSQVDQWLEQNVLPNLSLETLLLLDDAMPVMEYGVEFKVLGSRRQIGLVLRDWLMQFERVEFWGDVYPWDWVLLCELFKVEGSPNFSLPENVFYIPFDIATYMNIKGIDPDISREAFSGLSLNKHNALDDARIIRACYEKLSKL